MAVAPDEVVDLVDGQLRFSLDVYKEACQCNANLVFCPLGVCASLAMVGAGAKGNTAAEVALALQLTSAEATSDAHQTFKMLITPLIPEFSDPTDVDMVMIASAFYIPEGVPVSEDFNNILADNYRVFAQNLDFRKNRDEATNNANSWISKQTKNHIKNMANPCMFDDYTSVVLLNAICMKGLWEREFERENTRPGTFRLLDGTSCEVDMMYQDGKFRHGYNDALKCKVLEMLYKEREYSMVIILPNDAVAFENLEETLDVHTVKTLMKSLGRRSSVMVWLPRFQVEASLSLHELLPKVSITDMFSRVKANLSGITEQKMVVTNMLHKTLFAVDEEGSEGSVANMTTIALTTLEIGSEFRADHPFMYLVQQRKTGAIVFLGRLTQPSPSPDMPW